MRNILKGVRFEGEFNPALKAIVDGGFDVRGDCHFLAVLLEKSRSVARENFDDCTGYECFVNSVHVEDFDAKAPILQAILFIDAVFDAWGARMSGLNLVGIVSADEFSVVVKFHVDRTGESWVSDNVEGYEDPILIVDSSRGAIKSSLI
jgi:hypothetical protein